MKLSLVTIALATFLAATTCWAENMKPGLWEISNKLQSGSGEMEKAIAKMQQEMANMPPEQRKMLQAMLDKQGVSMGSGAGAGVSMKVCMTTEMAARNEVPHENPGDCKTTNTPTPNGMKVAFTCTNPPSNGEGQVTFTTSEAYTMDMTVTSVRQGKPEKILMQTSGKWLGADCGDVKSMVPLQKK